MVGAKYAWVILGDYSPRWMKVRDRSVSCSRDQLHRALQGYLATTILPLTASTALTAVGMVSLCNGPLARYVKLRVAHGPRTPGTFPRHSGLAIPTCIKARAWRTCRLAVSFEVVGGENVPGIPGACATRNLTYLVRGSYYKHPRSDVYYQESGVRSLLFTTTDNIALNNDGDTSTTEIK